MNRFLHFFQKHFSDFASLKFQGVREELENLFDSVYLRKHHAIEEFVR